MRSSILTNRHPLGRICNVCRREEQRNIVLPGLVSIPGIAPRSAGFRYSSGQFQVNNNNNNNNRQHQARRWASNSSTPASASAEEKASSSSSSSPPKQPPQTHYDFFPQTLPQGPPPAGSFDLDVRALRREFLQLQAKAHPDLHPPALKTQAEATSARINDAFRTLAEPLSRAQYLLSLCGRNVADDETAKVDDPNLLLEVLDMREEMEDAAEESDLDGLRARVADHEAESGRVLARCFAEGDLEGAARECVRLRYWVNIREGVHHWEKGRPVVIEH